ncbi:hypothetical protein BpHYR1_007886 [Brachionus plicatilis]|uniref:Uncharacterized protein n=1 Tax=Brachionus plicatilis TaxID=10195 RepID=A0A3M7RD61_BRAPC|nr:hypothetical protein BpHYR1_007886 [Brachionus plicatilis]
MNAVFMSFRNKSAKAGIFYRENKTFQLYLSKLNPEFNLLVVSSKKTSEDFTHEEEIYFKKKLSFASLLTE